MVVVIEIDCKWALLSYLASAVLVFLWAEPESRLIYVFFLGYYPILKAVLERMKKPVLEWLIKMLSFNGAVLLVYLLFAKAFGVSLEDFGTLGKYGAYILLALGNIVFVVYDFAVSRMASVYIVMVKPKLKKIFK